MYGVFNAYLKCTPPTCITLQLKVERSKDSNRTQSHTTQRNALRAVKYAMARVMHEVNAKTINAICHITVLQCNVRVLIAAKIRHKIINYKLK